MFGATSGGGLFGAPASSGGSLFGAPAASSGGGLFGAPASSGGSLFGAPAASSGGGLFGAAASSGGSLFGAPAASSGGGLFGAAASSGGSLFGAPAASSGGGLFGAAPSSGGGGLFGAAPASSGGGLFGSAPASSGGGLFGAAPASSGGGLFGAASGGGLFGGGASSGGGGLFGGATSGGGGLFGASASSGGLMGGASAGGGLAGINSAQAQYQVMEMSKRMEDLYPVLQRASGDRQSAAIAAAQARGAGGTLAGGLSSASNFLAYSYSFCPNPQLLAQANSPQAFNPMQHVDLVKWMEALHANPDPNSCHPEALVGLPALEQRLQQQQKGVEETNAALEELRSGLGNLKEHLQAQSSQRLDECRQRQLRLQRQLLQVVVALERRALQTGAARRNPQEETQLEARLARLEQHCCAPGGARARLEEMHMHLRHLLQSPGCLEATGLGGALGGQLQLPSGNTHGSNSSGVATFGSAAGPGSTGAGGSTSQSPEQAVLRVTAQQGELLELMAEDLARRRRDIAQLEVALQNVGMHGQSAMTVSPGPAVAR